jgi:hypothetical protein
MITQNSNQVKPCTTKELAAKYEVTPKVLRGWLRPHKKHIGKKIGHYYTILQIRIIFDRLGDPG